MLQQLNLQAHINAQAHSDEFVKEAFVSHDRITVLVRELLVAEVSRQVFRMNAKSVAANLSTYSNVASQSDQQHASHTMQYILLDMYGVAACRRSHVLACRSSTQVWRERVLPLLERHLAGRLDSVTAYQLLYQEAALANLIEVRCLPVPPFQVSHGLPSNEGRLHV